jgi:polysaccharide export outer membrane protein
MRRVFSLGRIILAMSAMVLLAQDGVIRLPSGPPPPAPAPGGNSPSGANSNDASKGATATSSPLTPAGLQEGVNAPVNPNTFKVGPEDVLEINVWREPQLSGQVVVRPDGMITATLVGELEVGGKTISEITKLLETKYGAFMNDPVVSVQPRAIRSSKYSITGFVNRPGVYPLVVETTVLDAVITAGGLQEYANAKKIRIAHKNGKQDFFNYTDVAKGKKLEQNIQLQNGDYIFVTQ